jgi:hypothetical protein
MVLLILCLIVVITLNFYINKPIEIPHNICIKGKYAVKINKDGTVYSKIQGISCETEKGIIIIEVHNDHR